MKVYELLILSILLVIIFPTISNFFKAITVWVLSHFGEQGYPVKYTDPQGKSTTLYLKTAKDVIEFTDNPQKYVTNHRELMH